jgi:predicted phage tail protein
MTISWDAVDGAVGYDVEWRKDSGNWIKLQRTGMTNIDVVGIYAGAYVARVRAVSAFDISSIWRNSILTNLKGKEGLPPAVSYLTPTSLVYGIRLAWGFPPGAEDTQRTEIWYSKTTSRDDAIKLGDFAYPQASHELQNILAGASFFFWARLVDRTGNVGPWYPEGVGVNGQASSDQTEYEKYFSGQIGESALGKHLSDRIELIDGPADLPGSVNNRIQVVTGEVDAISEKVDGVFAQVNPPLAGETEGFAGSTQAFVGVWSLQSAVIEGDVATGQRVDNVQVEMGNNSAVIQQVSQAQVALDGKASAMWSVKMQVDSNGRYVAAGIGLGIENGPAGLQSQFLVNADRFAVVNGLGGSPTAPFVVQDGQVFINQAFINTAFIKELILGMTLKSAALNNQGLPLLEINIPAGTFTLRGQSSTGYTLLNNNGIYVYDLNYIERAALGKMT